MTENISLDADSNTNQFMLPYKILMFIYAAIVLIQAPWLVNILMLTLTTTIENDTDIRNRSPADVGRL